jgi:hypothetical protein
MAYSACMRTQGVANFPDPNKQGVLLVTPAMRINPQSATFQAARKACRKLLPGPAAASPQEQQRQVAGELSFAKSMRSHGVPHFPDPNSQGHLSAEMVNAGVDIHAPSVQAAAQVCLPSANGTITAAQIRQAENGGH